MSAFGTESAILEKEAEAQRHKVEERIGQIRDRLSPGQLIDELMSYTKDGGQHFAANLGSTVTANPLPAALLGVSLVWLMSGQGGQKIADRPFVQNSNHETYPYATIRGGLRRTSHTNERDDEWYSSFADEAGKTYRARSNAAGERARAKFSRHAVCGSRVRLCASRYRGSRRYPSAPRRRARRHARARQLL